MSEISMESTYAHSLRGALRTSQNVVTNVNRNNGWYDDSRTFGDDIALLHSEVSEMLEAYRDHGMADATDTSVYDYAVHNGDPLQPLPKPEGVGSEAADVLVRLLDTCERYGIDLANEFIRKVNYNMTRGYKHGGKKL